MSMVVFLSYFISVFSFFIIKNEWSGAGLIAIIALIEISIFVSREACFYRQD